MMINDVLSIGCVLLSPVVLLLELLSLGDWDVKVYENRVHVPSLNTIEDSSEIIDRQCGLCMMGECVCVCVWRRWTCAQM